MAITSKSFLLGVSGLFLLASLALAGYNVQQYRYVGYRNVWNTGDHHFTIDVGTPPNGNNTKWIRNMCANYCSHNQSCDAFFVNETDNGACHIVDERMSPNNMTVEGHGWRKSYIFYRKKAVDPSINSIELNEILTPPCDTDEETLSAAECNTDFTSITDAQTYMTCAGNSDMYNNTVLLMSDKKCETEDRLLQCEMQNAEVGTVPVIGDRKTLFDPVFQKTVFQPAGLALMSTMTSMEITFKGGNRKITRVIIRTVHTSMTTGETTNALRQATLTVHQGAGSEDIAIDFTDTNHCAVFVNFAETATPMSDNADKLSLSPTSWWSLDLTLPKTYKMDVFVTDPVIP